MNKKSKVTRDQPPRRNPLPMWSAWFLFASSIASAISTLISAIDESREFHQPAEQEASSAQNEEEQVTRSTTRSIRTIRSQRS